MALTEAQYKAQVLADLGDVGASAQWELVFPSESQGGTWVLSFGGAPSDPIDRFASLAAVKTALEAVSTIGDGNIDVALGARGFILTAQGDLANQKLPLPEIDGSELDEAGEVTVVEKVAGKAAFLGSKLNQMWSRRDGITDLETRYSAVLYDAAKELRGHVWTQINVTTGDTKREYEKQFDHIQAIIAGAQAEVDRADQTGGFAGNLATSVRPLVHVTPNGKPYGVFDLRPGGGFR